RLPQYDSLILSGDPNKPPVTDIIGSPNPLALALDNSDNLITAEASNRVAFYFAELVFQNAANYNSQPLAPGMLALLYRQGLAFSLPTSYDPSAPSNIA